MNRKISGLIIISVPILFICFLAYSIYRSPIGPPDSIIQTDKECSIQKRADTSDINNVFDVTCDMQPYLIANSEFDLTNYIGKKVKIQAVYPKNKSNTDSVQTNSVLLDNVN